MKSKSALGGSLGGGRGVIYVARSQLTQSITKLVLTQFSHFVS